MTSAVSRRNSELAVPSATPSRITGTVCGVDVAAMEDPVEQNARHLDKLVDELTRERAMEKVPCA